MKFKIIHYILTKLIFVSLSILIEILLETKYLKHQILNALLLHQEQFSNCKMLAVQEKCYLIHRYLDQLEIVRVFPFFKFSDSDLLQSE